METEYIKRTGLERQKEVLIEALERAAKENGLFLNTNYKQQPHFYNKELQITPVNSLMMAMHDGIGTYEDALEYLQYEIGFGANACSCENPFMLYDKEVPYNVVSYEDCEIND